MRARSSVTAPGVIVNEKRRLQDIHLEPFVKSRDSPIEVSLQNYLLAAPDPRDSGQSVPVELSSINPPRVIDLPIPNVRYFAAVHSRFSCDFGQVSFWSFSKQVLSQPRFPTLRAALSPSKTEYGSISVGIIHRETVTIKLCCSNDR